MASLEPDSFVEKWQQLRLQFDLTNETGSVWLDGQLMVENMPLNKGVTAGSSPDLSISCGPSTRVWVEDLEGKLLDQTRNPRTDRNSSADFFQTKGVRQVFVRPLRSHPLTGTSSSLLVSPHEFPACYLMQPSRCAGNLSPSPSGAHGPLPGAVP